MEWLEPLGQRSVCIQQLLFLLGIERCVGVIVFILFGLLILNSTVQIGDGRYPFFRKRLRNSVFLILQRRFSVIGSGEEILRVGFPFVRFKNLDNEQK